MKNQQKSKLPTILKKLYIFLYFAIPLGTVLYLSITEELSSSLQSFLAASYALTAVFSILLIMIIVGRFPKSTKALTKVLLLAFVVPTIGLFIFDMKLEYFLTSMSIQFLSAIFFPYFYIVVIKTLIEMNKGKQKSLERIKSILGAIVLISLQLMFIVPVGGAIWIFSNYLFTLNVGVNLYSDVIKYIIIAFAIVEGAYVNYKYLLKESIYA